MVAPQALAHLQLTKQQLHHHHQRQQRMMGLLQQGMAMPLVLAPVQVLVVLWNQRHRCGHPRLASARLRTWSSTTYM